MGRRRADDDPLAADPGQTWRFPMQNGYFFSMFQKNEATDGITPLMLSR